MQGALSRISGLGGERRVLLPKTRATPTAQRSFVCANKSRAPSLLGKGREQHQLTCVIASFPFIQPSSTSRRAAPARIAAPTSRLSHALHHRFISSEKRGPSRARQSA